MLITPEYKKLNEKLHEDRKDYGTSSFKYANHIQKLCEILKTQDVLDYGCGKCTLAQNLPFDIQQYDPCIPQFSQRPKAADIVVCTDVLEHIEPDCLDEVLEDLYKLTKKMIFMTIANKQASKFLADGRNAHLIQENEKFWLPKLMKHFTILEFSSQGTFGENGSKDVLDYLIAAKPTVYYQGE